MHGVRMQMPDAPLLRRCFHSLVAMYQAAHNCDYYITKYASKALEQLQNLVTQYAVGVRREVSSVKVAPAAAIVAHWAAEVEPSPHK